jgi:hypothetical protein
MLSDKDLHGVYDVGAQNDHMTGLKAVWNKAIEWERARVASNNSIAKADSMAKAPIPGASFVPTTTVPASPGPAVPTELPKVNPTSVHPMASTPPVLVSPLVPPLPGLPVPAEPKKAGWV